MELYLNNIGALRSTNLNIKGLTVIAGKNGSGKTTIGKTLYATIKMLNNYQEDFKNRLQAEYFRSFYKISDRLQNNDIEIDESLTNYAMFLITDGDVIKLVGKWREYVNTLSNISNDDRDTIDELLNRIEAFHYNKKLEDTIDLSIEKYMSSEFGQNVINYSEQRACVKIKENDNYILDFIIDKENGYEVNILKTTLANDVTYIQTPYIFSRVESNNYRYNMINEEFITSSSDKDKDIIIKLIRDKKELDILGLTKEEEYLHNYFSDITGGRVGFNSSNRKFEYIEDNNNIDFINTATGIKSFAILDILLKNGSIKENDILIFDEPEVHLHPVWQVKYAKILILLIKILKIKIIINSHSTYFIEALKIFSVKYKIDDFSNFYILTKSKNDYELKDVSNNLQLIYNELNESFDILEQVDLEEFL